LSDGTLVLAVYHDLLTTPEKILEQNIEELDIHQPQLYFIDANHLAFLLRYTGKHKNGHTPPKAPILASYSPCIKVSKRQIEEAFGREVPFAEVVAMSELGFVAMKCPFGSLHLNTKSFYMELIGNGRPAEPGEMGELFMTSLDNGCIPHIRYRTGDIYRFISNECLCGHDFPIVEMEGRLRNFLFREGKIALTPRALDKIIDNPPWMDLYKMKQTDDNDFLFSFIANDRYEENCEEYIRKELLQALGDDIDLIVERTDYIPTERSGKFLSCVSKVGEKNYENGFSM
jgi:phenylacetate-CoA ligase